MTYFYAYGCKDDIIRASLKWQTVKKHCWIDVQDFLENVKIESKLFSFKKCEIFGYILNFVNCSNTKRIV